MKYAQTELGLTKATKSLLALGLKPQEYNKRDFDQPYTKQDNSPVKRYVKKGYGERKITSRVAEQALEDFQQNRLFSVIRGMDAKSDCNGGRG